MLFKTGSLDLGKDTGTWYGKIQSHFESSNSGIIKAGGKPHLQFTYKDLVAGMAVGSITVSVHGHILVFPIVIRGGQLEDFDTYFDQAERKWKYNNEENLDQVVNGYTPFVGLTNQRHVDDPELGFRDPQFEHTKIVTASLDSLKKMASVLDANPDLYLNAPEAFIGSLHGFLKEASDRNEELVKKASTTNTDTDLFRHWDIAEIRRLDLNRYHVKMAALGINEQFETDLPSDGVRALCASFKKQADTILDTVDLQDGMVINREPGEPGHVFHETVDSTPMNQTGIVGSAGTYNVVDETGTKRLGAVYPVIGWDGGRNGMWLFIDSFQYAYQSQIAGEHAGTSFIPPRSPLETGKKGVFLEDRGGDLWVTPPIVIKSISSTPAGTCIMAEDLTQMLGKVNLVISSAHKHPATFIADVAPEAFRVEATNAFLPQGMAFIEIGEQINLMKSVEGVAKVASVLSEPCVQGVRFEVEKTAGQLYPLRVYDRSSHLYKVAMIDPALLSAGASPILNGSYLRTDLTGLDFILKTANCEVDLKKVARMKPGERVTVCGGGIDKEAKPLTEAGRNRIAKKNFAMPASAAESGEGEKGSYPIDTPRRARAALSYGSRFLSPDQFSKLKSKVHAKYPGMEIASKEASATSGWETSLKLARAYAAAEPLSGELKSILAEADWPIVKTAVDWNTDESLNNIFKLNLVTPDNVSYFSDMAPAFGIVEEALVKLLLVSRLTPVGVEEELIRDTLEGVATIKGKFVEMKPMVKP